MKVTAVIGHSTHEPNGTQVWHEAGSTYDVDASDVDNLVALGFAAIVTEATTVPATPAAADVAPAPAAAPEPPTQAPVTRRTRR